MVEGCITDLKMRSGKAEIVFKTSYRRPFHIERSYEPCFYVPKSYLEKIVDVVSSDPVQADIEQKPIFPRGEGEFIKMVFDSTIYYKRALDELKSRGVKVFNGDLLHSQKVLFKEDLVPLTRYEFSQEEFRPVDENHRVEPPNLSTLHLSVNFDSNNLLTRFTYEFGLERETVEEDEEHVVRELVNILCKRDYDVLLVNLDRDEFIERASKRATRYNKYFDFSGKIVFSYRDFERLGLVGLEERCRFSMLPPRIALEWTAGRLVDSRQSYLAFKKGFLVPPSENLNLVVRSVWEIHQNDKGGLLQSPTMGLHENVAVLDFESMFPNIIVGYNVSYETVDFEGIRKEPRGLLVDIVEPFLERRLYFKHLKKRAEEPYRSWADQRQEELKLLLVSSYGYSGNNYSRFGNPLTFEWINRISRMVVSKVYCIARKRGFELVYSDTDSVFVKRKNATIEDFEKLAWEIAEATDLPIKVDRMYKFLVLLSMKADENLGATKRYYGRLLDGDLDFKGVEIRRRDYPEYIIEFQHRLADRLLSGESIEDVYDNLDDCYKLVACAIDEISEGKVPVERLVVRKVLRREVYRVHTPHYVAALQLRLNGYRSNPGETMEFIHLNSRHRNPMMRVQAWRLYSNRSYNKKKYIQLLFDAVESILLPFISNRTRFLEQDLYKDREIMSSENCLRLPQYF